MQCFLSPVFITLTKGRSALPSSVFFFALAPQVSVGLFLSWQWSVENKHATHPPSTTSFANHKGHFPASSYSRSRTRIPVCSVQKSSSVPEHKDVIEVESYCPDPSCPRISSVFPPIPTTPLPPLIFHIKTSQSFPAISDLLVKAIQVETGSCARPTFPELVHQRNVHLAAFPHNPYCRGPDGEIPRS